MKKYCSFDDKNPSQLSAQQFSHLHDPPKNPNPNPRPSNMGLVRQ